MKKIKSFIKTRKLELSILILAIFFSWWLMFSTFSYFNGNMLIASKAWSDFASHIPLIRSFSLGNNFPPQYPLFAGPSIKYHFLFYAFVGFLESLGLRIDYALNILSVIGFSFLIYMIFKFSKLIFKKNSIAVLSVIFFLFNGSLSFVKFFQQHSFSKNVITDILNNSSFTSFGPYDQSIVSAFWNLNIYTNQRHLALAYGISMFILYILIKPILENKKQNLKINIFMGIILGFSFFLNIAVFLMTNIILVFLFIFLKNYRKGIFASILIGMLIGLPQYLYTGSGTSQISFYVGYLISTKINFLNFLSYWFFNLGFHLIIIPIAYILSPKKIKFIFLSFFTLFIIGNLFKFSPEIAANHKFFNYFMIIGNMFSAYLLIYFWEKKNYFKPFVLLAILFLIASGILDFFPILNDTKISLADYSNNKDTAWIIKNTKKTSVFLNTSYLYDNASLAGRKIFLGWPYFAWSQGYDTLKRDNLRKELLSSTNKKIFCSLTKSYNIDYAELNINSNDAIVNKDFFDRNFPLVYKNNNISYYIYNIKASCL